MAGWVADNLAVIDDALADRGPLTKGRLLTWHRRLMRHADLEPALVGAWRDRLGWVGGVNPLVAAHVAVPPDAIPAAMRDLFAFAARKDVDAITQAAVLHAQFETIHPFADGNGRIGRVLIGRTLAHRLDVAVPPPVSMTFARDVGGYLSGLTLFRQGDLDRWVAWVADAVDAAARASIETLDAVAAQQERWRSATADMRADSSARRLVEHLPAYPVLSAHLAGRLLDVSDEAARGALDVLSRRGIVAETEGPRTRGRPRRWWVATDLLTLIGG